MADHGLAVIFKNHNHGRQMATQFATANVYVQFFRSYFMPISRALKQEHTDSAKDGITDTSSGQE